MEDNEDQAIAVLSELPVTKHQVDAFVGKMKHAVAEGWVSSMKLKAYLKGIEAVTKKSASFLDPAARTEAEKYGEKSFLFMGMKVELAENGTKYDYTGCCDPVLHRLEMEAAFATEMLEARRNFLKGVKGHLVIVDDSTGETATVYPPVKTSTSGLKMTLT